MGAIERFIQRTIEEQRPKRRNKRDDVDVLQEATRAAQEALRNGSCEEVQIDIWYE